MLRNNYFLPYIFDFPTSIIVLEKEKNSKILSYKKNWAKSALNDAVITV